MSAVEAPAKKPKEFAEVATFKKKYAEALEDARRSAEHTNTDGWQELYSRHRKDIEERRREIAGNLKSVASNIERGEITEETEKAIQDAKKLVVAVAVDAAVFDNRTTAPVRESVYRCAEVIEEARRQARSAETQAPLQARGVLEAMDNAIAAEPKVKFDADTGRVVVE